MENRVVYQIDKHIIPPKKIRPINKGMFNFAVGSDVLIEGVTIDQIKTTMWRASKIMGARFKCRSVNKGVRVWRIE